MPEPDLLIRTAGEMRVSNFLLWQISYAEIWVTDLCWPDFAEAQLHEAIRSFAARDRRFGGLRDDNIRVGFLFLAISLNRNPPAGCGAVACCRPGSRKPRHRS